MATTRKPSPAPANLVMHRGTENDGCSIQASWGVPADAIWESNHMWASLDEHWAFNASKNMSKTEIQQRGDAHAMADRIWVRDRGADHSSTTMWFNRNSYHPRTMNRYLNSVSMYLAAGNGKGLTYTPRNANGGAAWLTFTLAKPPAPKITHEHDAQTGNITFTIECPDCNEWQDRWDTWYWITRQDKNWNTDFNKETSSAPNKGRASTDTTITQVVSGWADQAIGFDSWIRFKCKAYSRGVKGDSSVTTDMFVYAYPAQARITGISKSGFNSTDRVTVGVVTNHDANQHPVDTVQLQRLGNTAISSAASAGLSQNWVDVEGAVDDCNCAGLADTVNAALPDVGNHTWYRIKSTHYNLVRYSNPVEATCLRRTSNPQSDDKVKFHTIGSGEDGESVTMKLAWKNDDSTHTEVSWSTYRDAWESTEEPEIYRLTWRDASSAVSGWNYSASVTIRGLETGEPVYVRARRVLVDGTTETPGPWCMPASSSYPVTPQVAPSDVQLTASEAVERGQGIQCSWTFQGGEQTAWTMYDTAASPRKVLASGKGADGGCTVPASKLGSSSMVKLVVAVTTGGDWVESQSVPVTIMDKPEISISAIDTLTAQPITIDLESSSSTASVALWISAHGAGGNNPNDDNPQPYGDIVWSELVTPDWVDDEGTWVTTITAPMGLDFRDKAGYTVYAMSTVGGLSSDMAESSFEVEWAHQAACPDRDASTVIVDADELTATITPIAPSGAAQTDVCDVYRKTPDGAYLIAEGVPFGATVIDPYTPYSNLPNAELMYLLCTRTEDGDTEWGEWEYSLYGSHLRIDWADNHVDLPYDVVHTTTLEKSFELSERLNGARVGNWDAGATRRESVTLDLVRNDMWETAQLLRELGRYGGSCFVRSHDGCAYEANVQLDSMELSYRGKSVPISLGITEIGLTEAFMQRQTDEEAEEGLSA